MTALPSVCFSLIHPTTTAVQEEKENAADEEGRKKARSRKLFTEYVK